MRTAVQAREAENGEITKDRCKGQNARARPDEARDQSTIKIEGHKEGRSPEESPAE